MKKDKMLKAMSLIDEEFVEEAMPGKLRMAEAGEPAAEETQRRWSFKAKAKKKTTRNRRAGRIVSIVSSLAVAAAALWLFVPFNTAAPNVAKYSGSEYYEVIQKLNEVTYTKPKHHNNFDKFISAPIENAVEDLFSYEMKSADMAESTSNSPAEGTSGAEDGNNGAQSYEEITDNQVAGVIEADRIKRSDKYIYYLYGDTLHVYTIEGEDSEEVGTYRIHNDKMVYSYTEEWELYLSQDCQTVTVVATYADQDRKASVGIIALDVSDPSDIREKGMFSVSGSYLSSRYTKGKILLMSQFRVRTDPDFAEESAYLPQIDIGNGPQSIPAESIIMPEELSDSRYAVVCKVDGESLELIDCAAFLSYSEDFYVSEDNIFATRIVGETMTEEVANGTRKSSKSVTEITGLSYSGETMELLGKITVDGCIKDQYSLDEYEGVLRVVTTTDLRVQTEQEDGELFSVSMDQTGTSANLYCISLDDWQVAAEVIGFAPKGEIVRSVRFDKDVAYVCTAVQLTDPVFFFDLSDLNNITYKETGDIEGYSSSLINFGDGYLLGVGVGSSWNDLKLEVYEERQSDVVSVCKYEREYVEYSDDYKAYYVDRENQLVGLGIEMYHNYSGPTEMERDRYLLIFFDGYELRELLNVELPGSVDLKRAVYIDGYFYMFGEDAFVVEKIGG